jgi:hypothetical protein
MRFKGLDLHWVFLQHSFFPSFNIHECSRDVKLSETTLEVPCLDRAKGIVYILIKPLTDPK